MSKYRFSIDAGIFTGARYIEPEFPTADGKGKVKIPGIFIPTGINGIDIKADTRDEGKRNASGFRAFLTFVHRGLSGKYIQTIRDRLTREGEQITAYNVPAYSVCYTLPEEKRAKIRAVLAKRVIAEHPELANQTDTQGTDLQSLSLRGCPSRWVTRISSRNRTPSSSHVTAAHPSLRA